MKLRETLKFVNHPTIEALKKSLKLTVEEAPQYINRIKEEKKIIYEKLDRLNKWYVRLIGLDEVKLYQDKVTSLQDQLLKTQEKRREVGRQLSEMRQKSLELQDQIHKVKRQDNLQQFLDLMREETEILKLENAISCTFQEYDQTERELFTAFTNAIRDSHEKQRAQIEYTKYFGLILSIAGSFLAFVYTSVKKQDLKIFIEEKLAKTAKNNIDPVVTQLIQINNKTSEEVITNRKVFFEVIKAIDKIVAPNYQLQIPNHYEQLNISSPEGQMKLDLVKVAIGTCLLFLFIKMVSG